METPPRREAYVSMITNDDFLPGAQALLWSISKAQSSSSRKRPVLLMVTSTVSSPVREKLRSFGARLVDVDPIGIPEVKPEGSQFSTENSCRQQRAGSEGYGNSSTSKMSSTHVEGWKGTGYTKLRLWSLLRKRNQSKIISPGQKALDASLEPALPYQVKQHQISGAKDFQARFVAYKTTGMSTKEAMAAAKADNLDNAIQPKKSASGAWREGQQEIGAWDALVYVDADALVLEDLSPIFERLEKAKISFAAAPDIFPPDKFNAGVLGIAVRSENENSDGAGNYSPSGGSVKISSQDAEDILAGMISRLAELGTYDGGDTGFLNLFFPNWWHSSPPAARLPFRYNAQRTLHWFTYSQQPGYWDVCKPIAVLHFSSSPKPWECPEKKGELELIWWEHFASALSAS